ncbi:hypothetical protein EV126DRAFT_44724 [Verticillium dahliae]|nr:hypothetical protein EV126DRAFT_44724 [Verticillium dahliae]
MEINHLVHPHSPPHQPAIVNAVAMAVAPGKLGLRCPDQGQFYVCEANSTEFVGCCLSDPCANGSGQCPEDELVPSSFSANQYAAIPAQDCEDAKGVSVWWTCRDITPPFLGCCTRRDLLPAKLQSNRTHRQPFLSIDAPLSLPSVLPSITFTTSSAGYYTTSSTRPSSPSQEAPSSEPSARHVSASQVSTKVLVGAAVGSAIFVAICALVVWQCVRHIRRAKSPAAEPPVPVADNVARSWPKDAMELSAGPDTAISR